MSFEIRKLDAKQPRRDINGIVFLAIAVFLAFAYYFDASTTGVLGSLFLGLGKGLFGAAAYALPPLFLFAAVDYFLDKTDVHASRRLWHIMVLLLLAAMFIQVFSFSYEDFRVSTMTEQRSYSALSAIAVLWSGSISPTDFPTLAGAAPGGLLGGLFGLGLQRILGQAGAVIFLIFSVIIELVLLVNLSFARLVRSFALGARRLGGGLSERVRGRFEDRGMSPELTRPERSEERYAEEAQAAPLSAPADGGAEISEDEAYPVVGEPLAETPLDVDYSAPVQTRGPFIDFEEREEGGAVHLSPQDMGLLGKYPEWDAGSAFRSDPDETAVFSGAPIASFDAGKSLDPLDLIFEGEAAPSEDESAFRVPDFLAHGGRRENASEALEADLNAVLLESIHDREAQREDEAAETDAGEAEVEEGGIRRFEGLDQSRFIDPHSARTAAPTAAAEGEAAPRAAQTSAEAQAPAASGAATEGKAKPAPKAEAKPYRLPPLTLLNPGASANTRSRTQEVHALGKKLEDTLRSFGVEAKVIGITNGSTITRFELSPGLGVKVSKIVSLSDDIALSLAAEGVRIEAPIPGKSAIGIEIPNKETAPVSLRGLLETPEFRGAKSKLTVALGRDIPGAPILCDLTKMPHLLIAGATGSGKSVCINSILTSILYRAKPDEVKLIMIDPKVVELSVYNGIPHLLAPVVTDPQKAANTLNWAVLEMTRRYALFAEKSVRDIKGYNDFMKQQGEPALPLILLVIDELSDLMMTTPREVEDAIARLTAMARAAGIHLIIATQRPSVDVITGVIKANIPSRIAFAVSSQVDSRTIIDIGGAEKLLGKGDMLYFPQSLPKPKRGQGAFLTDAEVERVVSFIQAQDIAGYDEEDAAAIVNTSAASAGSSKDNAQEDDLFDQAVEVLLDAGYASVSILQRRMNVGYPRAARLIDAMEQAGIIGPHEGAKPRKLLLSRAQWEARLALGDGDD